MHTWKTKAQHCCNKLPKCTHPFSKISHQHFGFCVQTRLPQGQPTIYHLKIAQIYQLNSKISNNCSYPKTTLSRFCDGNNY